MNFISKIFGLLEQSVSNTSSKDKNKAIFLYDLAFIEILNYGHNIEPKAIITILIQNIKSSKTLN